jgi:paraquat-inducible protein A
MAEKEVTQNNDLEKYVICPKCNTLHEKVPLPTGQRAVCSNCGKVLYRYDPRYLDRALVLAITGLIIFTLANTFPLISIDFFGNRQETNILGAISQLVSNGFYVVAIGVLFMVFVMPLLVMLDYMLLIILMKRKKNKKLTRDLLVFLSKIIPWNMVDIFAISVLISLVKLSGKVQIHIGVSFWALVLYILIDMYLTKAKKIGYLWELRSRVYNEE